MGWTGECSSGIHRIGEGIQHGSETAMTMAMLRWMSVLKAEVDECPKGRGG